MIHAKLTKLAKRLKIFSFEEFSIMSGENEKIVRIFLDELLDLGILEKDRQNSYKYNEFVPSIQIQEARIKRVRGTFFSNEEINILENERNTLDSYKNAPLHIQKMVDKYLAVLKACKDKRGRVLDDFIYNEWNKNNPDLKTSPAAFWRAKRHLKNYGIAGLISPCINFIVTDSRIDEDIYRDFADYVLKNKDKSMKYNYTKFKNEYLKNNPEVAEHEYAGYWSFINRIRRDVRKFKNTELAEIYDEKKSVKINIKKVGFKTFQSAAEDYLNDIIEKNEVGQCALKKHKRNINGALIPYFKKIKLEEIDEEKIEKYKMFLQEQQTSHLIIRQQLSLIRYILNIYTYKKCSCAEIKRLNSQYVNKTNILEEKQIRDLLNIAKKEFPYFYPLLFTVANTGLTCGEVLALTWDKFGAKNKKLKIENSIHNGKIITMRQKHARRTVDLPDKVVEVLMDLKNFRLKESQNFQITDYIFQGKDKNFQNPDTIVQENFLPLITKAGIENIKFMDLRDSYTVFLIKQNLPLTYVKEQLGIHSLKDIVDRYYDFIPKITKENLCIM